jgi:DNA-binding transcriptional MerR regulator
MNSKKENRTWLKTGELMEKAGVPKSTILYYRREGYLESVMVGRTETGIIKFKPEAVELVKKLKELSEQKKTLRDLIK